MKSIIRYLLKKSINVFSFFYSYETDKQCKRYKNILYSIWLKKNIKGCGNHFYVKSPVYFKGQKYMLFNDNFSSLDGLRVECWDEFAGMTFNPQLIMGKNVNMNRNVHIACINKVIIGNNVLFASNVFITDHQHGYVDNRDFNVEPTKRPLYSRGPVIIEDNVWIGENVAIMPNVVIGKGAVIGANSVVTRSCPPYSVIAGVPAKILRIIE